MKALVKNHFYGKELKNHVSFVPTAKVRKKLLKVTCIFLDTGYKCLTEGRALKITWNPNSSQKHTLFHIFYITYDNWQSINTNWIQLKYFKWISIWLSPDLSPRARFNFVFFDSNNLFHKAMMFNVSSGQSVNSLITLISLSEVITWSGNNFETSKLNYENVISKFQIYFLCIGSNKM